MLLVEAGLPLPFGAAEYTERPVLDVRQHPGADLGIVLDQIPLGDPFRGEDDPLRMRQANLLQFLNLFVRQPPGVELLRREGLRGCSRFRSARTAFRRCASAASP